MLHTARIVSCLWNKKHDKRYVIFRRMCTHACTKSWELTFGNNQIRTLYENTELTPLISLDIEISFPTYSRKRKVYPADNKCLAASI